MKLESLFFLPLFPLSLWIFYVYLSLHLLSVLQAQSQGAITFKIIPGIKEEAPSKEPKVRSYCCPAVLIMLMGLHTWFESKVASYSPFSALLLTRAHRALVKSN